jgi:hypothetical protein
MAEQDFQVFDTLEFDWGGPPQSCSSQWGTVGHYKSFHIQFKQLLKYMKAFGIVERNKDNLFLFFKRRKHKKWVGLCCQ